MSTQITFTDDALVPKCITFGGTVNVVRWYAYIKSGSLYNIYLQRWVDGVFDAEVLAVEANPPAFGADQPGLEYFNFIADPSDNTKAYLYFLSDGTLFRIQVTSSPIGELPTTQQFDRVNNRADTRFPDIGSASAPLSPASLAGQMPPPTMVMLESTTPGNRVLVLGAVNGPTERYFPTAIEVYRAQNEGESVLFATVYVRPVPQLILEVPAAAGGNTELWHARSVNQIYDTRSNFVHVWDNGTDPTGEAGDSEALGGASAPLTPDLVKVSRQPVKVTKQEPDEDAQPLSSASAPITPLLTKVSRQPIKTAQQEPDQDAQPLSSASAPLTPLFVKQRVV